MTHPLAQQLIDFLREASDIDQADAAGFVFMKKLRDNLVFCGLDSLEAETIASSMEIELENGSLSDEDMDTIAVLYCKLIMKAKDALDQSGFEYSEVVLKNIAKRFTLKLS